jgi:hypothetical protein
MKKSLYIVFLLTFLLAGEAIIDSIMLKHHDICLLDSCADSEIEKDSNENEFNNKLQIKSSEIHTNVFPCQHQIVFCHLRILHQVSREILTPPPEFLQISLIPFYKYLNGV